MGARRESGTAADFAGDGGAEVLSVAYGTTTITAQVRRSARRRTVALTIDPELGLIVTAPSHAPRERLEVLVRGKARWVVGHLRAQDELEAPMPPRQGRSGESLLYLGRHYRIDVSASEAAGPARLRGKALVVPVVSTAVEAASLDAPGPEVCALVREWLQARAACRLPERVELWARRLDVAPSAVLLREPTRRWGSCNERGELRLNWRIIQAPMALVDYVVAHELTHLIHKDHSPAFWAHLGEAMPDYELRREELRRLGPQRGW